MERRIKLQKDSSGFDTFKLFLLFFLCWLGSEIAEMPANQVLQRREVLVLMHNKTSEKLAGGRKNKYSD